MSRKKKRPSAAQRKQDEIQRRIKAAEDKASKPAKPAKKEKPCRPSTPKPKDTDGKQPPTAPRPAAKQPARPSNTYPERGRTPAVSILKLTMACEGGSDQCCTYDVTPTVRLDIRALFDAIRKERPGETGAVYITTNLAESSPGNYNLSYDYAAGLFTRREALSGKNAAKNPALMADILDRPVKKIRCHGGWGRMDWYVNIAPDMKGDDNDA